MPEKDIDQGARLMAIADIFAALTEDRPYRRAMSSGEALDLIRPKFANLRQIFLTKLDNYHTVVEY